MAKDSRSSVINDPKIEAVLDRLHHQADRSFRNVAYQGRQRLFSQGEIDCI
ncbi:MAG: hypothetical protein HC849_29255 [Oscillatoriales cyanobacterium RU_3_3]|nr:hypothetical protein [Oscillatoriales cyanobacterium RU_3_3]